MKSKKLQYLTIAAAFVLARLVLPRILSTNRSIPKPKVLSSNEADSIDCPSGNTLHVEFDGARDKPVLVFLHGLNSSSSEWFHQRLFFQSRFRLMFIDLPGHGKSALASDPSISAIADDLRYLLNHYDIQNPILYGHSLGGIVVMKYCIDNTNASVKGIVILHSTHTNALTTTKLAPLLVPLQNSFIIPFLKFSLKIPSLIWAASLFNHVNGIGLLFYRYLFFSGKQTSDQINFNMKIAFLAPPQTVATFLLELIKLNLTDDLKKIQVPALVLAAYEDRLTTPEANEFISSQIRGSQLKYVRTGHLSLIENFNEVNSAVNRYISGLGGR